MFVFVVLIFVVGCGECFFVFGGNIYKCIGWCQFLEVVFYCWLFEENGRIFDFVIELQIMINDLCLMLRLVFVGGGIKIVIQEIFRLYIESGKFVLLFDDFFL